MTYDAPLRWLFLSTYLPFLPNNADSTLSASFLKSKRNTHKSLLVMKKSKMYQ